MNANTAKRINEFKAKKKLQTVAFITPVTPLTHEQSVEKLLQALLNQQVLILDELKKFNASPIEKDVTQEY